MPPHPPRQSGLRPQTYISTNSLANVSPRATKHLPTPLCTDVGLVHIYYSIPLHASSWPGILSERGHLLQSGFGCPTCWTCSCYCRPSCSPSCWCCACLPSWGHDPAQENALGYLLSSSRPTASRSLKYTRLKCEDGFHGDGGPTHFSSDLLTHLGLLDGLFYLVGPEVPLEVGDLCHTGDPILFTVLKDVL